MRAPCGHQKLLREVYWRAYLLEHFRGAIYDWYDSRVTEHDPTRAITNNRSILSIKTSIEVFGIEWAQMLLEQPQIRPCRQRWSGNMTESEVSAHKEAKETNSKKSDAGTR